MLDFGFYNMDCMEGMKQFPDKYFDLAVVDPPYGDGGGSGQALNASENGSTDTVTMGGVRQSTISERTADSQTARGVSRTGGGWARRLDPTKKL